MNYYVLQVITGRELFIKKKLKVVNLICPLRKTIIQRKGKKMAETKPIFPGYLFFKTDKLNDDLTDIIKNTDYIIKILNSFAEPIPLNICELESIIPLFNPKMKPELSKIKFDKSNKIVVINGPLKYLEGKIVKVDKRKQRATVAVEMYNNIHKIDFSYIDISK